MKQAKDFFMEDCVKTKTEITLTEVVERNIDIIMLMVSVFVVLVNVVVLMSSADVAAVLTSAIVSARAVTKKTSRKW